MASVLTFIAGAALLIYSAEKLITYLVGMARGLVVSLFLLAVLFTGIEMDDLSFSAVLNAEGLEDVALGVTFGTVISMTGLVLGIAAVVAPCRVEIPKDYIAVFAVAPLVLIVPALLRELGTSFGVLQILLFALFVVYVGLRESRRASPRLRYPERPHGVHIPDLVVLAAGKDEAGGRTQDDDAGGAGDSGDDDATAGELHGTGRIAATDRDEQRAWALLLPAVLALTGLVAGAWAMSEGTEGIQERFAISGTVFGATIATLVLSLEDVLLTAEPARRGAPAIGIGNVIGSVVFSVTAKLGVVALAGGALVITPEIFTWHLPSLVVINGFAAYALLTGHLRRRHGVVLLVGYLVYWIVSFSVFGVVPVDDAPGSDT
ncbi:hypothetical protein [Streptomyces sp. NPDC051921]|uniref:sodium:calcium antiporter n=1 Tax=Streptomyces sp. NPDC051921 TaxID=3155806 RepID=UPI0034247C6F